MVGSESLRRRTVKLVLVGVPVEVGANVAGSRLGPSALRRIGLSRMLGRLGCDVVDRGDLAPVVVRQPDAGPEEGGAHKASEAARWISSLSEAAYELARAGHVPVFLGGDHSLSMGTVDGIARACAERGRELFVLWLDAHPDFNTPAISPTGNFHGMALAYLCGEAGFETVLGGKAPRTIDPRNVYLFGTRSIDPDEGELLRRRGVNMIDMRMVRQRGIRAAMRPILETVAKRDGVLHLSLDADVLDPSFVPGVNVPERGGLTYAEAHVIMELLNEYDLIVSADITELNPLIDVDGRSTRAVVGLASCLFDQKTRGRHDHSRTEDRHGQHTA
ncbi:MAG: arginase [Hyphomicrobium sp.]|jgi:arginase